MKTRKRGDYAAAIETYIRKLYAKYQNQTVVAETLGITQAYVQQILAGKTKTGNMRIDIFDKMFPNAQVSITGDNISVNGVGNVVTKIGARSNKSEVFRSVQDAIMTRTDLSDADKVRLYTLIAEICDECK